MPKKPSNWEIFDKFFHPELEHIHPSDKPRVMRGLTPNVILFDEHLLMQETKQEGDINAQSAR